MAGGRDTVVESARDRAGARRFQGGEDDDIGDDCAGDFPSAPRAFAGAGVHEESEDFGFIAVGADPYRQQDVLECKPPVVGAAVEDALSVAADVGAMEERFCRD